jgi:iron complex transport system substrate-binding protein
VRPASALLIVALLWPAAGLPAAVVVVDDTGAELSIGTPAQRIVSLSPHLTELLFSAGAGEHIAATVEWSDYPAAAAAIPLVGNTQQLDMERIVALQPDLVVAWLSGNGRANVDRLKSLGLRVYVSEPATLDAIGRTLGDLAALTGATGAAPAAQHEFAARLAALRTANAARPPIRVFYQIWGDPIFTVNGRHLISQVIELCGGVNVFADLGALSAQVDVEAVLRADPEAIVASGVDERRPEWLSGWERWPELAAVSRGNVFHVPPALIQRHTMRILDGAERMCGFLDQARRNASLSSRTSAARPGGWSF